jgi:hypothetical protein
MQHRPLAIGELEADAHAFERKENVREDNGGIEVEAPYGLQSDLDSEFRCLTHFQKAV